MRVSLNDAISTRGPSGTARGTRLIQDALTQSRIEVERLVPPSPGRSKILNAVRSTVWDFRGFDAEATGDVLISPTNVGMAPSGRPHLLWVHDTMVLDHPGWFDRGYAAHARLTFGLSILRANAVATPSNHAKARLARRWPAAASKIRVVPWPASRAEAAISRQLSERPVVLMLGATEPHKRHLLGIESVRLLRLVSGVDVQLKVVGPPGRADTEVAQRLKLADPEGAWTARTTLKERSEVEAEIRRSWLLLQCSLDEGFCLPLVEAASYGVPAIHTGGGSMTEVHPVGNCGSDSPHVLAERMFDLLDDTAYARESASSGIVADRHSPEIFRRRLTALLCEVAACT